jgi:hypothetical protein
MELTAKEKAKELVDRYNKFDFNTIVVSTQKEYAKQCALIAVDEMIKEMTDLYKSHNSIDNFNRLSFWFEVKKEINNL